MKKNELIKTNYFFFLFLFLALFCFFGYKKTQASFGTEMFLHMDKSSVEVGQLISGSVKAKIYKKQSGETAVVLKIDFGDGTSLILGHCSASPEMPDDFAICDFDFIHVYDTTGEHNLSLTGMIDAHYSVAGPEKTITVTEKATSTNATSIEPALVATSTAGIIRSVISAVYWIVGSLLLLIIMVGGFYIITSAGNPKQTSKGKQIITYALIGFLIMLVSRGILQIIYLILNINVP